MKRAAIATGFVLLGWVSTVHAETADELFNRGRTLAAAQRYAEACPLLAESVKADPGIGARLWLGECYEKTGRLASALEQFKAAAEQAASRNDDRQKVALRRASALDPRVPRIVVVASEGVVLTVDERPMPAGIADPVDAGLHTVKASSPGFVPWSATISVPDAPGAVTVNVPGLAPEAKEPAPPPIAPPPAAPERRAPATVVVHAPGLGPMKIASIATGAIGLAALGGGVFLGLQAKSTYDDSNQGGHCIGNACDATGRDLRQSATSMATLSTVGFVGAGAALAASIALFALSPSTSVTPAAGPHEAGLSLTQRF